MSDATLAGSDGKRAGVEKNNAYSLQVSIDQGAPPHFIGSLPARSVEDLDQSRTPFWAFLKTDRPLGGQSK